MKNLIGACKQAIDAFEGGDIGVDENYPDHVHDQISSVVEQITILRTLAEEQVVESEVSA